MKLNTLSSPLGMLKAGNITSSDRLYLEDHLYLEDYENWWEAQGKAISTSVDQAGTPWLKMFDASGQRIDKIGYEPAYWQMLKQGYKSGVVWRVFKEKNLMPFFLQGYITSFYDPGLYCPYTVSMTTAMPLHKYGSTELKLKYLQHLLKHDDTVWQGATWMTEIKGGSDLGNSVETIAKQNGHNWILNGDKYFASNVGAELAIVAARPEQAPAGVMGVALFLLPRLREDGQLNYTIRRLKNKIGTRSVPTGEVELHNAEAYLLGDAQQGIYLILEALNISRVANSIASIALAQRALAESVHFAEQRIVFGKPLIEQPLMRKQFQQYTQQLEAGFALAWESVDLLNEVWHEKPPYSDRYHLYRLVAHLAKYWTAKIAVQTSTWAMEVHGGLGILAEFPIERCFREAMILTIWEGTSHRQILDGLEVMQHKKAHVLLFEYLKNSDTADSKQICSQIKKHLKLPEKEQESQAEEIFEALAAFTAHTLIESKLDG